MNSFRIIVGCTERKLTCRQGWEGSGCTAGDLSFFTWNFLNVSMSHSKCTDRINMQVLNSAPNVDASIMSSKMAQVDASRFHPESCNLISQTFNLNLISQTKHTPNESICSGVLATGYTFIRHTIGDCCIEASLSCPDKCMTYLWQGWVPYFSCQVMICWNSAQMSTFISLVLYSWRCGLICRKNSLIFPDIRLQTARQKPTFMLSSAGKIAFRDRRPLNAAV